MSQAQGPKPVEGEEALIAALLKVGKEGQAVGKLLDEHTALITPQFWDRLTKRALSTYYFVGADQSLTLYGIALSVAERLKDQRLVATSHYNIGRTYSGLGRIAAAIQSHLASRRAFDAAGLRRDLIYVLSDLASLYYYAGEYKTATSYAEQCCVF
ncbi:MAG: hypothetical protein AB7U82_25630 [Blastocatellales bacterium]